MRHPLKAIVAALTLLLPMTTWSQPPRSVCLKKELGSGLAADSQSLLDQIKLNKGQRWELLKSVDKKDVEAVFKLYQDTYSKFGMVIPNAEKLAQSRDIAVIRDNTGKIISYMFGRRDEFGFLLSQIGADTSRSGLQAVSQTLKANLPEGIYLQTSGQPLNVLRKAGQVPIVPYELVQKIRKAQGRPIRRPTESELKSEIEKGHLPNDPEVLKNAYFTTVVMNGEVISVIKVLMGKPNLNAIIGH